ncbi:MAG TPA: nuclear transport factor 2 family protein [Solirubrobacterales bacterium]|nr:nuclear transport factor 2 family protein [Solirubrobacterales bacterium]
MTSANEQLTREGFGAWSSGDWDEAIARLHPEIEWHIAFRLPDLPPDMTVARGHDEVRHVWDAFGSAWQEIRVDIEEVLDDAENTVVSRARFKGRGASSGIEVDRTLFYVAEIRDEKLWRLRPFDSLPEARRAAGLDS